MSREFIRVTVVLEYPVDPSLYPGSKTPGERAAVDLKTFIEQPEVLAETIAGFGAKSVRTSSFTIESPEGESRGDELQ